ncbi:MAG: hypothetical protein ABI051_02780 [Vicinamibacterales bacterium]
MRHRSLLIVTPLLALLAPIVHTLGEFGISVTNGAVLVFLIGPVGLALVLGTIAAVLYDPNDRSWWRPLAVNAVLTVVVALTMDVAFGGQRLIAAALPFTTGLPDLPRRLARLTIVLGVATAWLAAVHALRRHFVSIAFTFALVLFVTATTAASVTWRGLHARAGRATNASTQPVVIYLIFDGMLGVEGIDRRSPGGDALYAAMRRTLDGRGFRAYGKAFSRHSYTEKSLANVMNFVVDDDSADRPAFYSASDSRVLEANALFDSFNARGQQIHVYQTPHLDFCDGPQVASCLTLPSFNPVSAYMDDAVEKDASVAAFFKTLYAHSYLLYFYADWMQQVSPVPFHGVAVPHLDVYAFVHWFDRIVDDIRQAQRGDVFFAHILTPHAPHLLDAACKPQRRWTTPYSLEVHGTQPQVERNRLREQHDGWYNEQASCVIARLGTLLDAVDHVPALRDATIVIHGDHGSRVSSTRYWEGMSGEDLVANYSTLFAIRGPGVATGYDLRLRSVQQLARETFGRTPQGAGDAASSVIIESPEGSPPLEASMPDFSNGRPTVTWTFSPPDATGPSGRVAMAQAAHP